MGTMKKRTDQLKQGDVIVHREKDSRDYLLPISSTHPGHLLVVQGVHRWMLTAGPHAGHQATNGRRQGSGAPLFTLEVTTTDRRWDMGTPVATADEMWDVVTQDCAESAHSWCETHDAAWAPFADTCTGA